MNSFTLIRAANRNELSLVLRAMWQKSKSWDPYNVAKANLAKLYADAAGVVVSTCCGAFFVFLAATEVFGEQKTYRLMSYGIMLILLLVSIFLVCEYWENYRRTEKARGFEEAFGNFLEWTDSTLRSTAILNLQELRNLAKKVLVEAAKLAIVQKGPREPEEAQQQPQALMEYAERVRDFENKYKVLEDLGLVYGGHEYFYKEARNELAAEAAKAEAEAAIQTTTEVVTTT